jgi:hypothetical protein
VVKIERDLRKAVLRECETLGCRMVSIEHTNGGHLRIRAERGDKKATVITALTPGCSRHMKNTIAELRRQLNGEANENE